MKKYIEEWVDFMRSKKKANATVSDYEKIAYKVFSKRKLKDYEATIQEYFDSIRELQASTIRNRVYLLNSFQKFLLSKKYLDEADAVDIKYKHSPSRIKKHEVKIITPDEQIELFKTIEKDIADKLAITIFLKTGVRDSEFAEYLNDVDEILESDTITISGKSITTRQVFISKEIKDIAREFKAISNTSRIWPSSYPGRDKKIKAIGSKCGLKLNLHMLRATFATEWHYHGHDLVALQQAMGHSSLAQLDAYINKNQLVLIREWEEFSRGANKHDRDALKAENKKLREENRRLNKELILLTNKYGIKR